ncbi:MAG: hypothetical protein ACK4WH_04485 [Phycisphaerales bacterium]
MSWPEVLTPYSDLPEMSARSPQEQRKLIGQASRRRGDALWVVPMFWAVGVSAVWAGVSYGIVRIKMAIDASRTPLGRADVPEAVVKMLVLAGLLAFVAAFILVRRRMVIVSLRFLVNKAGCPYCQFSLVGLSPEKQGGTGAKPLVRCPECGELVSIFDHGILPGDLLTEQDKRRPFAGAGPAGAFNEKATVYAKKGWAQRLAASRKK